MTSLASIAAGSRILASAVAGVAPLAAVKSASQSVTSSTTLVNDQALLLPLNGNSGYIWVSAVYYVGGTPGSSDLKCGYTWPAGANASWGGGGNVAATGLGANFTASRTASGNTVSFGTNSGGTLWCFLAGTITVSTAGLLQFQWAQNTSSSTATTVNAGSWIAAWQVS